MTKQKLVEDEISRMRDEEGRTGTNFSLRTAASRNVLQNMTQKDLIDLTEAVRQTKKTGYSQEHKQR